MIAVIVQGQPIIRHDVNTFNVYLVIAQALEVMATDYKSRINIMVDGKFGWPISGVLGMGHNEVNDLIRSILVATGIGHKLTDGEKKTLQEAFPKGYERISGSGWVM